MKFRFFKTRKKREVKKLSLDELKHAVTEKIENDKKALESVTSNYMENLEMLIEKLIKELKNFEPTALHPRLTGIAKNFKSSMLELWDRKLDYEGIRKNMVKMALFKLKHYRVLFAVNPEELSKINEITGELASIISTIENKRRTAKFNGLNNVLLKIEQIKEIDNTILELKDYKSKLMKKLRDFEKSARNVAEIEYKIREIEKEIDNIELEISKRENRIGELLAVVRKAVKTFAHDAGLKLDFNNLNDLQRISGKVANEIKNGNVKLKAKRVNKILFALNEIENGKLLEYREEVELLRKSLRDKKQKLQKLKAEIPKLDFGLTEREIESVDDKIKMLVKEKEKIKSSIEYEASKLLNFDVSL